MSRNVFESIPFASYFAPHRRKVEGSSSTSVQEMDSGQKFSNATTFYENSMHSRDITVLRNAMKIRNDRGELFSKFFQLREMYFRKIRN